MKKNFIEFRQQYGQKKTLVTVPGTQDDVINRMKSRRPAESEPVENAFGQTPLIHISQLHQKRAEISTPSFNEPRMTIRHQSPSKKHRDESIHDEDTYQTNGERSQEVESNIRDVMQQYQQNHDIGSTPK